MNTPKVGLYIIGDEILSGKRTDKHLPKTIEILSAHQLSLAWVKFLPDDFTRLVHEFRLSFQSGEIVFSCGGIGSTPDDKTRQAAAQALNRPLLPQAEAIALITQRICKIEQTEQPDLNSIENQHRLQMGYFPEGSEIIPNAFNGIPGFYIQNHSFMPGFPEMAWDMMQWTLEHRYAHLQRNPTTQLSLICYHIPESNLTSLLLDIEQRWCVQTFSLPSERNATRSYYQTELGVKGDPIACQEAFEYLKKGLATMQAEIEILKNA